MSRRPSYVLSLLLLLGGCNGSAPANTGIATENGGDSANGAAAYGINTGIVVESKLIRELDTHNPTLKVDVRLSPPSYGVVWVKYSTADASARADEDYRHVEGTLKFNPGELVKTIEITVLGDETTEGEEQFMLLLQLVTKDKTLEPIKVPMTIMDDD